MIKLYNEILIISQIIKLLISMNLSACFLEIILNLLNLKVVHFRFLQMNSIFGNNLCYGLNTQFYYYNVIISVQKDI